MALPSGASRAKSPLPPSDLWTTCEAILLASETLSQFLSRGDAQLVELDEFHHPFVGAAANRQLEQQGGDQRQINLDGRSLRTLGQPVPAAQNAFDPPEKQFHLPALFV